MKVMISAYLDNNIGDDLMIKLLSNQFKNHQFYLYSNRTVVKNTFSSNENIVFRDPSKQEKDLSNMDIFLTIGGSVFNNLNSLKGQLFRVKKIMLIKKAKRKGLKIATIGCNLGPYNNKIGILLTKWELKNNDLITVRDNDSFNLIKSFKIIKNAHLADDIVYNFKYKNDVKAPSIGLGISVYRSVKQNEQNYQNYEALAKIADQYINKTEKKVRLFAFDSETENDLSAAHHIINLSSRKDKIEIIAYLGDESSFIDKFRECESFIAIRFHSAILSDMLNIPFLPIIYSNKMSSLLIDRKYQGQTYQLSELNINNISKIVELLIDGSGLYNPYHREEDNSNVHFDEFEKLLIK